jgi:hypothetical protein
LTATSHGEAIVVALPETRYAKSGDIRIASMLVGSIGAREATVVHEWTVADLANLADLEKCWAALGKIDTHKKWSRDMEPYVLSGSARWEIYRIV